MADEGTVFSDLTRDKLEILLRLSEAAFPIWQRLERAWADEVPDHVGEATQAFVAVHDAAKAWLETGVLDAEELQMAEAEPELAAIRDLWRRFGAES